MFWLIFETDKSLFDNLLSHIYRLVFQILNRNCSISDEANLYIGKYGFDCGTHLYGFTSISKDLRIHTQDSLVQYKCDSVGKEGDVPIRRTVGTQEMSIMNGKIVQSKLIERTSK